MISVAMTTYNGEKYIEDQLRSILNQTLQVNEIIICDDGSTDQTANIILNFNDSRIVFIRNQENLGYIENFYKAISLTTGDYIFLADQDDIWKPDKAAKILGHMKKTGACAVCTSFELIDGDGKRIEDCDCFSMDPFIKRFKGNVATLSTIRLSFGNVAQGCTYCFTKSVREAYLRIHNQEVIHDLQIMIIASCMGEVHLLNQKLIEYRIHGNNSIGFVKKGRDIEVPKKISKEPFMYRFLRQVNEIVKVRNLWLYKVIYYLRIPYIRAVFRRMIFAE